MKKKIVLLLSSLSFAVSATAVAFLPIKNNFKSFANEPYSCELPTGYVEIDNVITEAISNGETKHSSDLKFRGTVTKRLGDVAYVQRVNQGDNKLYGIKVTGLSSFENDISIGNVLDFRGGLLYVDNGTPTYELTSDEQYSEAYAANPYGYEPRLVQSVNECYESIEDNPYYDSGDISTFGYGLSRLITVKNVQPQLFLENYELFTDEYFNFIYGSDCGVADDLPYFLGVVNGDYDEVKTITNTAIATNKTLTITGLLTYRYDTFLFEILDQSDVTIGESSIDLDVVSEVSTMEFIYNDYFSLEFAKYFLNGYGDVPYVELTDFYNNASMKLLYGNIGEMHKNDGYYGESGIFLYFGDDLTGENRYQIAVDPSTDEMWVLQDIPGGVFNNNSHTYNDMEYMGDGIETALCMIDTENSRHLSDRFQGYYDFARYNLDIVVDKNNVVYFPLLAVNYIFNEAVGYPLVYNGEDLYFAFNIYDDDDTNPGFCKVIDDSVGNRFVSECPWLEDDLVSEEYATHAYNCFCLALEECYGLSYHRGIIDINDPDKSADSYLNDLGYKTSTKFLSNDIALFEDSFATFVGNIYYDGHSGYLSPSVALENDNKQLFTQAYSAARSNNNERYNSLMSTYHELDEARKTSSRQIGLNVYEDTAIIVFDGFEKYYEYNGGYLPDASKDIALNHLDEYSYEELHEIGTDLLFRKAFNEIEANPDIENVVFDISMNGGGMVDSLPFLEAYMSDDPHITMNNKFDGGCNEIHYKVDINYDGVFDENDTYKGQYNFYLLTSNYSFSCGNYFPTVIKEMGAATLFGERSGGGACAVGYLSTPYGGLLRNSSNFQLGHWDYDNEEFINNDDGIEVDYAFDRQYFYDDEEIYNFVHAHQ